eukprot:TRINITY_DN22538_c0_g1_i1.p1 TRINITY_DN22538_c0_g1~~TRINITY_DN22538_c0_g1_i1.p1  ORF type:complete len:356 (+),score=100.56 TRINITY_DN22538_c0_g1_i1:40-1107(+)
MLGGRISLWRFSSIFCPRASILPSALVSSRMSTTKKHWKEFSQEDYDRIAQLRLEQKAKSAPRDPKATYKKLCRACDKPNALEVDFCTGCGFTLDEELDVQRQSDNIFLDLIRGENTGTNVLYRDDGFLVFDDKFGVSDNHLDVIPTVVIDDITSLTAEHIPMLERLYQLGVAEFERRRQARTNDAVQLYDGLEFDDYVVAGYNFPVSVKHLHLHIALPPFKHEKVFQYPRWHSHKKVVADLKQHGRVVPYAEQPNDAEGSAVYDSAIQHSRMFAARLATPAAAVAAVAVETAAAPPAEARAPSAAKDEPGRPVQSHGTTQQNSPGDAPRINWLVVVGTACLGAFFAYRYYNKAR